MKNRQTKGNIPLAIDPRPRSDEGWLPRHEGLVASAKRGDVQVAFFGDSITEGIPTELLHQYFGPKSGTFGIGGDRTQNLLWRMKNGELSFPGSGPDLAIVLIGTNNLADWGDKPATNREIVLGIKLIAAEIAKLMHHTKILLVGILPREEKPQHLLRGRIKRINTKLELAADDKTIWFADVGKAMLECKGTISTATLPDFLHPSKLGYELLFTALKPHINRLLPSST